MGSDGQRSSAGGVSGRRRYAVFGQVHPGAGVADAAQVAHAIEQVGTVSEVSQTDGAQTSQQLEVLMVVRTAYRRARDKGITIVGANHIAPGTIFDTPHIEMETAIAIEVASYFLISFGKELQTVVHTALLHTVVVAITVRQVKIGDATVGRRIAGIAVKRQGSSISGEPPKLRLIGVTVVSLAVLGQQRRNAAAP